MTLLMFACMRSLQHKVSNICGLQCIQHTAGRLATYVHIACLEAPHVVSKIWVQYRLRTSHKPCCSLCMRPSALPARAIRSKFLIHTCRVFAFAWHCRPQQMLTRSACCRYDKFSMDITQALQNAHTGSHEILVQVSDPSGNWR